jgi:hypothetical protein
MKTNKERRKYRKKEKIKCSNACLGPCLYENFLRCDIKVLITENNIKKEENTV